MSNTIIRPKDRTEWLKYRESGIGSSEVATIVGLNPWETPYQLWRRKVGLDAPKQENFAMKAGHYLEDAVSLFWQDETGQQVIKSSAGDWLIRDDERPYLQVSPDRTYWLADMPHSNENKGILECKTTQMTIDEDDIPKHWFVQVQYQLGVAGYQHGSLAWLTQGRNFGYKDLAFVPDFFAWLVEEVDKFWVDNIQAKQEPTAANVQDILLKYNRHTDGKIVEVNDEIFAAYQELKEVRDELSAIEEKKAALEEKIKLGFGDAEAISYDGQTLATWKAPKPSNKFDAKAFTAAHPDLAKEFTFPTQGARRFLLK
jgi:putative phage-type endonuclease|nr:MAG TPA: Exonuclease [Caudoviricetes sp.]